MKKALLAVSLIVLLVSCGKSLITIPIILDDNPHPMFGKYAYRDFYVPVTVSDSLNLKWESEVYGGFKNSSVSVYDGYVFTSDLGGRIYAFDIKDGSKVGMLKSSGALHSAPLINKTMLIYAVAEEKYNLSELIYYDYMNGQEVHYEEFYSRVLSEMIAIEDGIIFLTESGRINKYDFSGNSLWQTETGVVTQCSPSSKNGIVIFGNDEGEVITVNVEDGKILNRTKLDGIFSGAPAMDETFAYMSNNNGNIYAIDFNNGEKIWEFDTGAKILMSPAVDDKNVVIGNLAGALYSLNKQNGKVNWGQKYKGLFNATPLLTNNRIIIPDLFRSYYLIDKETGELKKILLLENRAKLTPVFYDSTLIIGFDRGIVRAYEFIY